MNTLECKTCGKTVIRNSGIQKYCASCSPDWYRVGKLRPPIKCEKCGKETPRIFNRQKYCRDCSPYENGKLKKPVRILPKLICCRCGSEYGNGAWNASEWKCKEDPCPKCEPIVENRKRKQRIKWAKEKRKELKLLGKWLLILEETAGEHDEDHLWTRMRYVSDQELETMKDNIRLKESRLQGKIFTKENMPLKEVFFPIHRDTGWCGTDGWIDRPGYYRVEPLEEYDDKQWWRVPQFNRVCSGGIPRHERNATVRYIDSIIREREETGRVKAWERKCEMREKKHRDKISRRAWDRTKKDYSTKQFFTALTMAGAMKGE